MSKNSKFRPVDFPTEPYPEGNMRLFPDDGFCGAASATECTGLVQIATEDDDIMEAYGQVCSYRQDRPIIGETTE